MAYPDRHGTNRATFVRARRWRRAARTGRPQHTAGGALPLLGGLGRRCRTAAQRGLGRAARQRQDGVVKAACDDAPRVEVLALTPRDIPTPPALTDALLPRRGLAKLASRLPRKVGIASVGSAEWPPARNGWRNLAEELAVRCRRKPLVLLLDEAHTLALDVGSALLNASQQVCAEAPFLLVLAGTPGLPAHLNAMDTSFWGRLGEGLLGVGRLTEAAARAALSKPLTRHDVEIDADALDTVIEDSQRYPYFVQLWGDALWQEHLANPSARLTTAATAAVQDAVTARVANYYEGRYQELAASDLLSAATAVAPLFQGAMDATASN